MAAKVQRYKWRRKATFVSVGVRSGAEEDRSPTPTAKSSPRSGSPTGKVSFPLAEDWRSHGVVPGDG